MTQDQIVKACKSEYDFMQKIYCLPEMKKVAICLEMIHYNGTGLEYMPDKYKTEHVCTTALKKNYGAYRYFPERFKTEERSVYVALKHQGAKILY